MRKALATIAVALTAAATFTPLAAAQQQPTLQLPATVKAHGGLSVETGPCETFSTVTSPGLKEPITLSPIPGEPNKLRGFGEAVRKTGTYTAIVQCGNKTLTAQFTVELKIGWWFGPLEVEPGGKIYANGDMTSGCRAVSPLTSPGFAAPLELASAGMWGGYRGETTVTTIPGTYEVVWQCNDGPERDVKTFRVLGDPPVPPTTTTQPPPGKPQPKPPIVKPKGAPQTGGGGTA
ncbi:hypothetical protein ABZX92_15890 [Lentzea sp. NPDC006480]|uniref:hypothetical protein n=1 Tax=Lentzea sp. NPDC006480 TaxID=3157176 RepID=UPI0033B77DFA